MKWMRCMGSRWMGWMAKLAHEYLRANKSRAQSKAMMCRERQAFFPIEEDLQQVEQ